MILNVRGTNGSGKTTVARSFISAENSTLVSLAEYKTEKGKDRQVDGYYNTLTDVCVVGPYRTACGGMDAIPSFALSQEAVQRAAQLASHVICEGILASTVFGSWAEFARTMQREGYTFAFAYLQTPLDLCLARIEDRIRARGGEVRFKRSLVADKFKAISGTRKKAIQAGFPVYDLPADSAGTAAHEIVTGNGEKYRAS